MFGDSSCCPCIFWQKKQNLVLLLSPGILSCLEEAPDGSSVVQARPALRWQISNKAQTKGSFNIISLWRGHLVAGIPYFCSTAKGGFSCSSGTISASEHLAGFTWAGAERWAAHWVEVLPTAFRGDQEAEGMCVVVGRPRKRDSPDVSW